MERYCVNFEEQTITITNGFAKKLNDPTSDEYKLLKTLTQDFPTLEVVHRTHKSPTRYENKQGEKFNCNQFKNLSFENMKKFISGLPNSEAYEEIFEFARDYAGVIQTNKYTLVRRWFVAQFPDFRKNPVFYKKNPPAVIDFFEVAEKVQQEAEERKASKEAKKGA